MLSAALFLAFPGEHSLAELAGWSPAYSWAAPFVLSAYALVSVVVAGLRRTVSAYVGASVALLLAMAGQVTAHLIESGYAYSGPVLVAAVSAVPPLVVGHIGHMLFHVLHSAPESSAEVLPVSFLPDSENGPENGSDAVWEDLDDAAKSPTVSDVRPDVAAIREAVTGLSANGRAVTGRDLASRFGVSERTGRRYLAMTAA